MNLTIRITCTFVLAFTLAGCESDKGADSYGSATEGQIFGEALVDNDCHLPTGVVFEDCISSDWQLPSYYYMPADGSPGREVFASEQIDHFIRAQIIEEGAKGNRVVDAVYGHQPANALFRFRVSDNQSYPADIRDFRGGALEFDLRVLDWGDASGISVRVECGWPCTSENIDLNVKELGRWQSYRIPAQKLVEKGLDLSRLDSAVNFVPSWDRMQGIHFQIDNLRWAKGEQNAELPYRPKVDWAALALKDLEFIYNTALEDHPGTIDPQNPQFREYLDSGYKTAQAMAEKATSRADYQTALSYYMAGFADGHFMVGFNQQASSVLSPGFNVRKQGADYQISHLLDGDWAERPAPGDRLLSCDGRTATELMEEDVLNYIFRDNTVEAAKWQNARQLFTIGEIGNRKPYERCEFIVNGNTQSYTLNWQSVDRGLSYEAHRHHSYPEVSEIEKLEEGLYWVYLPSFLDLRGRQITAIEAVIEELKNLPDDSTVVFDMRFNGGGDSRWGFELLGALHGRMAVRMLNADATTDSYAEFRVSRGNYKFHRDKSRDQTLAPHSQELMRSRYEELKAAYDAGEKWYRENNGGWLESALQGLIGFFVSLDQKQRTVLLTSPNCASACLDFADLALLIPGTIHMGQETSADTNYIEIRFPPVTLPSQQGRLALPMKVWRNRIRGHNESYIPGYLFDGDIEDTQAVRDWVMINLKVLME